MAKMPCESLDSNPELSEMMTLPKFRLWLESLPDTEFFVGSSAKNCPIAKYIQTKFPGGFCGGHTAILNGYTPNIFGILFDNGIPLPVWAQNYSERASEVSDDIVGQKVIYKQDAIALLDRIEHNCAPGV